MGAGHKAHVFLFKVVEEWRGRGLGVANVWLKNIGVAAATPTTRVPSPIQTSPPHMYICRKATERKGCGITTENLPPIK